MIKHVGFVVTLMEHTLLGTPACSKNDLWLAGVKLEFYVCLRLVCYKFK